MTPFADLRFMDAALALARTGLGTTAPNPSVGCVIVRDGRIAGTGRTAAGGRPHAETEALKAAGAQAAGATAYVTLEPCAHTGMTPPCTDALIAARITRVVVACGDRDRRVSGEGLKQLRAAGVEVVSGVREAEALRLNAGFFCVLEHGRPLVAIDAEPASYDAELPDAPHGNLNAELASLAKSGITRVNAVPGSAMAAALFRSGLVDYDAHTGTTSR